MLVAANRKILNWRSHEYNAVKKVFGNVYERSIVSVGKLPTDTKYIRWFPDSEEISIKDWNLMLDERFRIPDHIKHINDPINFKYVHDKIQCFDKWKETGIKTPQYYELFDEDTSKLDPSKKWLIRINNGVAGQNSILTDYSGFEDAVSQVFKWKEASKGKLTKCLATEFIDTSEGWDIPGYNISYRIIVAGNKVITGYARVSDKSDWVAITNKFTPEAMEVWFYHNTILQDIMTNRESEIVNAVKALGLNHQGVDVIPRKNKETGEIELFFLEVQTTYDAGFIGAGPYIPPYYNPYNPHLLSFINDNKDRFIEKLPLYYFNWLDKKKHFEEVYENIIL